jgi:hypothetical protein
VSSMSGLDNMEKRRISPLLEFKLRPFIKGHYTDCFVQDSSEPQNILKFRNLNALCVLIKVLDEMRSNLNRQT